MPEEAPKKRKARPSKWKKPIPATFKAIERKGGTEHRCGRCKSPAFYGTSYPGQAERVPPEHEGKVLWACRDHHAAALRVVIGWCEAKADLQWADRLRSMLQDWEARLGPLQTPP